MSDRVIVINPNSTKAVTESMDRGLDPLRLKGGPEIECVTNHDGPPGIEKQQHVEQVSAHICRIIKVRDNDARAFVIACFSDPGMFSAREITTKPVFGIAESGILSALSLGNRFGIIAILAQSIPRHIRYIRSLGLEGRLAGDLAIGLGVTELAEEDKTFERMVRVGEKLRDDKAADVLVLGCAGMARYRGALEERLGVSVVDPAQAAVGMAISAIRLGQTNSTRWTLS